MLKFFTPRPIQVASKPLTGGSPDAMLQSAYASYEAMHSKMQTLTTERERIDRELLNTNVCLNAAEAAINALTAAQNPFEMAGEPLDISMDDFTLGAMDDNPDEIGEPIPVTASPIPTGNPTLDWEHTGKGYEYKWLDADGMPHKYTSQTPLHIVISEPKSTRRVK